VPFLARLSACPDAVPFDVMRRTALLLSTVLSLAAASIGQAKPGPDGLPAWLAGSEHEVIVKVFGNAHPVLISSITYPRKIAVVIEFQDVVTCRTCSAPTDASLPHGRVVRFSFDRKTHRLNGEMRFCEVTGITPPLSSCLAR
jgi:hypothetical protein